MLHILYRDVFVVCRFVHCHELHTCLGKQEHAVYKTLQPHFSLNDVLYHTSFTILTLAADVL